MLTLGCDVSHWEGIVDWQRASQWIPFAYYKCTDGEKFIDEAFEHNKGGCQATGMPHAAYHYFQPEQDPIIQADHYVDTAGDGYGRYIIDVEQAAKVPNQLRRDLLACLQQVERRTSIKPAIYTSAGFWNQHMSPAPGWTRTYELIVAHYTVEHAPILPTGWDRYVIWQFTDMFHFPGCDCAADGDWFNGSLAQCREWFGNFRPSERPIDEPPRRLIARSQFEGLHVRQQPSKAAREIGHLAKGEMVEIENLGGRDVWIKHAQGWTAVEISGYRYMEVLK